MRPIIRIRYIAEPKHVREVTLTGSADYGFWADYLRPEGLAPVCSRGGAQVVVVAAEMVYLGLRFTEVSFSVRAVLDRRTGVSGMRLLYAFSSSRVFSWCERAIFTTPYGHGECHVSVGTSPSVRVDVHGAPVFRAEMSSVGSSAVREGDESWEGAVFLPPRVKPMDGRLFFGRLSGHTVVYPFSRDDRCVIESSVRGGMLRSLADSGFQPQEWAVRADATHARSRTYRREIALTHDHGGFQE